MERITFYCDGSCSGTNEKPGPAGAGIVALCGTKEFELSVPLEPGTSQQAELRAVIEALRSLGDSAREFAVEVFTDSAYVVGVLTQNWALRANIELVAELRKAAAACGSFQIQHVPGHSGHALNERAHNLAQQARSGNAVQTNYTPSISIEVVRESEARVEQLVKALQFYAEPLCYLPPAGRDDEPPGIVTDRGAVARSVLAAFGYLPSEEPFAEV